MKHVIVAVMFAMGLVACTGTAPALEPEQNDEKAASVPAAPQKNWRHEIHSETMMASHEINMLYRAVRLAVLKDDTTPLILAIPKNQAAAEKHYLHLIQNPAIDPDIKKSLKKLYAAHLNYIFNAAPHSGERASAHESRLASMRADFDLAETELRMEVDLKYPVPRKPLKTDAEQLADIEEAAKQAEAAAKQAGP